MDEKIDYKRIQKKLRKYRRHEKYRKFIRSSKFFWILDPRPYETHIVRPRSVIENHKREKIRRKYSWHNIARFQNEEVFRVGLLGIVTAPILAGLSQTDIPLINFPFPIQMFFIFFSGILYVTAAAIYVWRVPSFVSEYLDTKNKKYKAMPMRELSTNVYMEFLKLSSVGEITPENIGELQKKAYDFETALGLSAYGYQTYKSGFDFVAQAYIESLLYKIAKKHGFNIYTQSRNKKREVKLSMGMGPGVIYSNESLYYVELNITRLKSHFALNRNGNNIDNYNSRDLVIDFHDTNVKSSDGIDRKTDFEAYTHGLDEIIREEYKAILVEELSYWQSWQRPFSRFFTFWLYRMSLLSFIVFLLFQARVVWTAF